MFLAILLLSSSIRKWRCEKYIPVIMENNRGEIQSVYYRN